jgi:hypothetical protein
MIDLCGGAALLLLGGWFAWLIAHWLIRAMGDS